jgi:hypothetical protein
MITTETGATVVLGIDASTPSGRPYATVTVTNDMGSLVVALDRDELFQLLGEGTVVWRDLGRVENTEK